jgi:hypothetical protein
LIDLSETGEVSIDALDVFNQTETASNREETDVEEVQNLSETMKNAAEEVQNLSEQMEKVAIDPEYKGPAWMNTGNKGFGF